jgi:hypothetical protein
MSEAVTRQEPDDPLIGKVLDERYRIEEPLGQGGIGKIYKARHLILGRYVAVKVLLAQYESIPVLQVRFKREAEALASLSHPNIVTITDFGVAEGMPYLVMELLEGQDLAAMIEKGPIEPAKVLSILRQSLRALAYAHNRQLVHRDLKPHNIYIRSLDDGTDHVEVLDFGLARFMDDTMNRGPKLTKAGALIGTPAYMAPEQASGEAVDARADVYAAAIVLFEALTGRKPFDTRDPAEILRSHMLVKPPRIDQGDPGLTVSEGLEAFFQKAASKRPGDRFATAQEMLAALDALGPEPVRRTGARPARSEPLRTVDATQTGAHTATRAGTPGTVKRTTAKIPPGTESAVVLPKSRMPLLAALGCLAGVLVGGAIALVIVFKDDLFPSDTPAPVEQVTPEDSTQPGGSPGATPTQEQDVPDQTAPRDPFVDDGVPPELADVHTHVHVNGRHITRDMLRAVEAYRGTHPDDARPYLLVGHGQMNAPGPQLSAALTAYEQVSYTDISARGYEHMLTDLLLIVRSGETTLHGPAALFIQRTYRAEAAGAIDAQLAGNIRDPAARRRLQELRASITEQIGGIGAAEEQGVELDRQQATPR